MLPDLASKQDPEADEKNIPVNVLDGAIPGMVLARCTACPVVAPLCACGCQTKVASKHAVDGKVARPVIASILPYLARGYAPCDLVRKKCYQRLTNRVSKEKAAPAPKKPKKPTALELKINTADCDSELTPDDNQAL